MPTSRLPLAFGGGLDRESGIQVVQPNSFFDLRNCFLHQGKAIVRYGFTAAGAGDFEEVDLLLSGHGMRGEQLGIAVGWNATEEAVYVYRCAPDLSTVDLVAEWVNDNGWGDTIPRVIMTEVFGRVFMAHDEPLVGQRAATAYYDSTSGELKYMFSQWADGTPGESAGESAESTASEDRIRFRGVVRHLSYLVGWGFGTATSPRPEFLRISLPDDPTTFDPKHYFIVGDRDDAIIGARPVGGDPGVLKVWKRQEAYDLLGSDRRSFGMFQADESFGLIAGRAVVSVGSGIAVAWSEEGPRLWAGRGPSQSLEIPLGLDEWEPTDLPDEGEEEYAYGLFIPRERVAWFGFNRRAYALTTRAPNPASWRWSYQQLPWDTYGAMTFYEGELAAIAPVGYPAYNLTEAESASFTNPTIPGGSFCDVSWRNFNQDGDEIVEVWLQPVEPGSGEPGSGAGGSTIGATDFSEFSVGAGLPAGISYYGEAADQPGSEGISNDATEGNYFRATPAAFDPISYGLDAFDGITGYGEFLARVYIPSGQTNRRIWGPASMVDGDGTNGAIDFVSAGMYMRTHPTDYETHCLDAEAGSVGSTGQGDIQEAEQASVWAWVRFRIDDEGAGDRYRAKIWYGAIGDEPAGWDVDSGVGGQKSPDQATAIGWACAALVRQPVEHRIAFLSFSDLPDVQAPLEPGEIPTSDGEWFLAGSFPVSTLFQQTERVTGLDTGQEYNVALRYRRGLLYNPGAEDDDDPSGWPSVSQGNFTTTLDPPSISDAVWARTGGATEGITLTIEPDATNPTADVNIYRREAGETEDDYVLVTTLNAPHADPLEYEDTTIAGETIYFYAVTHDNGTNESPFSDETRIWSGPADIPVRTYLNEFVEGYTVGFTLAAANDVELHDTYDNNGGTAVNFALRETQTVGGTSGEISALNLLNVDPDDGASFAAKLRVKETAFSTDDYGEFSTAFPVNVEGSAFE